MGVETGFLQQLLVYVMVALAAKLARETEPWKQEIEPDIILQG